MPSTSRRSSRLEPSSRTSLWDAGKLRCWPIFIMGAGNEEFSSTSSRSNTFGLPEFPGPRFPLAPNVFMPPVGRRAKLGMYCYMDGLTWPQHAQIRAPIWALTKSMNAWQRNSQAYQLMRGMLRAMFNARQYERSRCSDKGPTPPRFYFRKSILAAAGRLETTGDG